MPEMGVTTASQMQSARHCRRALLTAVAGMSGALALAACGTSNGSQDKPATGAVNASGTVRYAVWGNANSDMIEMKVINAFHAKQS